MTDLDWSMYEDAVGRSEFRVADESRSDIGFVRLTSSGDSSVTANTTWGNLDVSYQDGRWPLRVLRDGRLIGSLALKSRLAMKYGLSLPSGREIDFKLTLLTDTLYHRSELGEFEYKSTTPTMLRPARCRVLVRNSVSASAEDVALTFMGYYCLQYSIGLRVASQLGRIRND